MLFFRQVGTLVWKDLVLELRTKEMLNSMLVFAFLVIVIFAFAFNPTRETTRQVFPGMVWVAFTFAALLGLNRTFAGERSNDTLQGLMSAPMDRTVIYTGKVIGNFILTSLMEAAALPLFFFLFNFSLQGSVWWLITVVVLGTVGFVAVGTFMAALAANARAAEVLLPLILFPLAVPVIIAAVEATGGILLGEEVARFTGWVRLLVAYDIIFLAVPFLLFDQILEV